MPSRRRALRTIGCTGAAAGLGILSLAPRSGHVRFDGSVPRRVRDMCRRAATRVEAITGHSLESPVRVIVVEPDHFAPTTGVRPGSFGSVRDAAVHVRSTDWPQAYQTVGQYRQSERQILLARDQVTEPLVAHELTHALQHEQVGDVEPPNDTLDGEAAVRALVEGTAYYVQARYDAACRTGSFDRCIFGDEALYDIEYSPLVLARGGASALSGLWFAHDVVERRNWSALWEAHSAPPEAMTDVMFPDRYFGAEPSLEAVPVPNHETDAWLRAGDDRLGGAALYTKLAALGATRPKSGRQANSTLEPLDGVLGPLRPSPLQHWTGDRIVGYAHVDDPDRVAYLWRTHWRTEQAAAAAAEEVRSAYERVGQDDGGRWRLDSTSVDVNVDGAATIFTMAPTRDVLDRLFGDGPGIR